MKTFAYRARDATGTIRQGGVEAADRRSAISQLKAKGWIPISVAEGAGPKTPASWPLSTITFSVCVAAVALLVIFVFVSRRDATPRKRVTHRDAPVTNDVSRRQPSVAEVAKNKHPGEVVHDSPPPNNPIVVVVPPSVVKVTPKLMPKRAAGEGTKGAARVLVPGIRRHGDTNAPNPYATFRTRTERMLSMMINAKPGERIIGVSLGRNFDQDFLASLSNKIEVYPTDSPEVVANKEEVARWKEEMRKLVEQGQSAEEILTTFREEHNKVADYRSELQRQALEFRRAGKADEAEKFVKEANKALAQYGTSIR